MDGIHEGKEAKTFTKSNESEMKEYCTVTGMLASDKCTSKQNGWYVKGKEPQVCDQCGNPQTQAEQQTEAQTEPQTAQQ